MKSMYRYPQARVARWLRLVALHSLLVLLSMLIILLPMPILRVAPRAQAQSALVADSNSFSFSDQNESAVEHGAASDGANALKVRTSPIGASGAYTRAFPIRVPPGRSGMTPSLALTYSSASAKKTSAVGAGWSFGTPSISRSTEDGFPMLARGTNARYSDSGLFTSPAGRLAPFLVLNQGISRSVPGSVLFMPVRESEPVRYEFSDREDRWVEHLPSGAKRFYGASDGRTARIVNELGTHEWLLLKERDADGNTIEYDYHFISDVGHGQARGYYAKGAWQSAQWQPILKSVRWGANDGSRTVHQFRVETEVVPFDGDIDMLNGHVVVAGLVTKISVFGPPITGGAGEVPYWAYTIAHETSKDSGRKLLKSITETATGLTPRTTTFTYSSNGDPYAALPGTTACTQTIAASFDTPKDLSTTNPEIYRTGPASTTGGPTLKPLERLSQRYIAGGYQFRDMDADGDSDVSYMPAGISAPVAQWLKAHSYVRDGANWVRASGGSLEQIPSNLLITEFGDIDGDIDPDAISFPLWSIPPEEITRIRVSSREKPYHYANDLFLLDEFNLPNAGYTGVGLPGFRLSDGAFVRAPANARPQVYPLNSKPGCIPIPSYGGGGFVNYSGVFPPLNQDWEEEVERLVPEFEGMPNPEDDEFNPIYRWRYFWWFIRWNFPWPWRKPGFPPFDVVCVGPVGNQEFASAGHSSAPILIGRNPARGAGGVTPAIIDRWPDGVHKWVEPYLVPIAPDSNQSQVFFRTMRDFHAPATDLNADGKADILLLKMRDQVMGPERAKNSFIPRAYISDGQNFYLDWLAAAAPPLAIDVSTLVNITPSQRQSVQEFRSRVLPQLTGMLPGIRALPGDWTAPLRGTTRTALTTLLKSYTDADASNPARVASFTTALTKLFEDDLWARIPRPVLSLKGLFERWNSDLYAHAWDEPQGLLALVPMELVPNVQVDLSDLLIPYDGPPRVNLTDLVGALLRPDIVVGDQTVNFDAIALVDYIGGALAKAIGGILPGLGGPPSQRYSSFSLSALDILRDGREVDCNGGYLFRKCKDHHSYPQSGNFNTLPLDINADGLPDLVVAQRPIPLVGAENPEARSTMCARGHQVHLNRGYRWDNFKEWAAHSTAFEAWSSPTPATYAATNGFDSTIFPMEILQNHSGPCSEEAGALDYDAVDLAVINAGVDTDKTIRNRLQSRLFEALAGTKPEWDRTGAAADKLQTPTLPMAAASFTDFNADGRVDLVLAAEVKRGARWNIHNLLFLNTGRGFRNVTGVQTLGADKVNRTCVLPPDFVMAQFDSSTRQTVPIGDRSRLADVDNDGMVDLVYAGFCQSAGVTGTPKCSAAQWRRNLRKVPDLLTTIEEPTGAWEDVAYVAATSDAGRNGIVRRPGALPQGTMVVSQIMRGAQPNRVEWQNLFADAIELVTLSYDNYARETNSTHSLGFETVSARFSNSQQCTRTGYLSSNCAWKDFVDSTTVYDVRPTIPGYTGVSHPLRSRVLSQRTREVASGHERTTTMTYSAASLDFGAVRVRPHLTIESTRMGALSLYSGQQFLDLDTFGYPQRVVAGRANATQVLADHPETTTTKTQFEHRAGEWRLGRPKSTIIEGFAIGPDGGSARKVLSQSGATYNAQGRVATTTVLQDAGSDCTGNAAQWSTTGFPVYNAAGLPTRVLGNGRTIEMRYDAANLYVALRWIVVPASDSSPGATLEEALAYDPRHGSQRFYRDLNGEETTASFDASGRVLTRNGPDGDLLERNTYADVAGGPWTITAERAFDPGKFIKAVTFLDGQGRETLTNEAAPVAGTSNAFVRSLYQRIDGFGRIVESYQPRAVATLTTRGLNADLATKRVFDGFDRPTLETLPDGRTITHLYSLRAGATDNFSLVQTTNPRNFVTQRVFDSRGVLARVERLAAAGTTPIETFDYLRDGLGRMTEVRDLTGTRRVTYDVGGRLTSATLAHRAGQEPNTHQYCFDADGQLISALTPAGREVLVRRDTLGRPQLIKADFIRDVNGSPAAEPTVATFSYDCSVAERSLGKLCERSDDSGITRYTYDPFGRQDSYELELSDVIASTLPDGISNWYRADFTFGLGGQLKTAIYEGLGTGVHRLDYTHDAAGRTSTITADDPRTSPRKLVNAAGYDEFGRVVATTLGNNVVTTWAFDKPTQHLTGSKLLQGTTAFAELRYPLANYDRNGNLGLEEHWQNSPSNKLEKTSEKRHSYDALDRLTASSLNMDSVVRANESFAYSGGNVTQAGTVGALARYDYLDNTNTQAVTRIAATGYERVLEYDADGWVSRDTQVDSRAGGTPQVTERELTFDAGGCLREATSSVGPDGTTPLPTVTKNICGLSGARAYRETRLPNGNMERVFYLPNGAELRPDQDLFVMRLPVATATAAHLAWSLRTGGIVPSESGYVHTDMRGSVIARTPLDASNVRLPDREAEYDAWGKTFAYNGVATPRYQFIDEEPDPGTGYYFFGARAYDPTLRRWLSPDPLILGNVEMNAQEGNQLNLYAYSGNNPVAMVDPDGRFAWVAPLIACGTSGACEASVVASVSIVLRVLQILTQPDAPLEREEETPEAAAKAESDFKEHLAETKDPALADPVTPMDRGRANEAKVLSELGLEKNTEKVSTSEGNSVPDALTDTDSVEIKDTKTVSADKQVRIQSEAARASGRQSTLVTGDKTRVTKEAQKAFDHIVRHKGLGPQ